MKQEKSTARWIRNLVAVGLIVFACFAAAWAQPPNGTVIPSVCFEAKPETFTRTATANFNSAFNPIDLNQAVPDGFYALVINPGGATQESLTYGRTITSQTQIYMSGGGLPHQTVQFNHSAGETILLIAEGDAVWGYNNTSSAAVAIGRGVGSNNYFYPGTIVYTQQPNAFQPGVHENIFTVKAIAAVPYTWFLNNGQATSTANAAQACATITYQGRLSDAGVAASGQYDLQFQAFDALTGGASQSELIKLEDVQVTNGVFTVPLNFGSSLTNNLKFKVLEIGVRAGTSTGAFTVLTPRQPITTVPYAVNANIAVTATTATNATTATTATNATQLNGVAASQYVLTTDPRLSATNNTSFIQNSSTQQTGNFNINGNGTIGGNLTANSLTGNGAGLTGIFSFYSLNTFDTSAPANPTGYSFIGAPQTVNLNATQRLTGSGAIPLAVSSGTTVARVGLCFKIGSGAITNFAGGAAVTNTIVDGNYTIYAASASVVPGAGSVQFGLCVGNNAVPLLSNSVNGWVMVTNN